MVDSGSHFTVIRRDAVGQGVRIRSCASSYLVGAGNAKVRIIGEARMAIRFKERVVDLPVRVIEDCPFEVILGLDWMKACRADVAVEGDQAVVRLRTEVDRIMDKRAAADNETRDGPRQSEGEEGNCFDKKKDDEAHDGPRLCEMEERAEEVVGRSDLMDPASGGTAGAPTADLVDRLEEPLSSIAPPTDEPVVLSASKSTIVPPRSEECVLVRTETVEEEWTKEELHSSEPGREWIVPSCVARQTAERMEGVRKVLTRTDEATDHCESEEVASTSHRVRLILLPFDPGKLATRHPFIGSFIAQQSVQNHQPLAVIPR